ncbi:MAG: hypothetical protein FWB91_05835 [Defluviitaleaceae bacterium]|nr:hypothetical protein [Defluviitaleaceae bacterium]
MRSIRCSRCKKKFEYEGMPPEICPTCVAERANALAIVRELVRELPGITALEVHDVTGVPMSTIMRYVAEGHLSVVSNSEMSEEQRQRLLRQVAGKIRELKSRNEAFRPVEPPSELPPETEPPSENDDKGFQWR